MPAEVDLSGLSVERARFALGRLREAVAARKAGGEGAPDFRSRPRAEEQGGLNGGVLKGGMRRRACCSKSPACGPKFCIFAGG